MNRTVLGFVRMLLCAAALAGASCALSPRFTTFRVEGLVDEAVSPGPYRSPEPGEILDAHANPVVLQRYFNVIRPSVFREQEDLRDSLIQEFPTPSSYRRVVETRRGLLAFGGLNAWIDPPILRRTRRMVVEANVLREWAIRDLPLVEHILNAQSHVDDEYESFRRAVLLDSEGLAKANAQAYAARFWLCVRTASADAMSIELFGRNQPYSADVVSAMHTRAEQWLRSHRIDARVRAVRQSAGDTFVLRLDGAVAVRVEMIPVLSRKDGTLMLVSDPSTDADRVYR